MSATPAETHSPHPKPSPEGEGLTRVRVDDGVAEGGEVSMFYDPMIAKLITWGPTREEAIDAQVSALDAFEIAGIGHNVDFLSALMQHPRFRAGELTTGFIAEEYPEGFTGAPAEPELRRRLAALAATLSWREAAQDRAVTGQLGAPLLPPEQWVVRLDGEDHAVSIAPGSALVDGETLRVALETVSARRVRAVVGDEPLTVGVERGRIEWSLTIRGATHRARALPRSIADLAIHMIEKPPVDHSNHLLSPMPGLLTQLHVGEGDRVEAGQPLAVVEAMKMENILRAPKSATVAKVSAAPGASLAVDQVILEFA